MYINMANMGLVYEYRVILRLLPNSVVKQSIRVQYVFRIQICVFFLIVNNSVFNILCRILIGYIHLNFIDSFV